MQVNSISDVIIAIALAAIPIIGGWIGKVITGNSKATTLINVLSPLAKAAIVAMQKLGVTQYLEGETKKFGAVDIVKQALSALGLSDTDEAIIKNAIEKEYAVLINELNQTYPQMTAEQAKAQDSKKIDYQIESGVLEASQIHMGNLTSLNITTEDKKTE